MIKTKKVNTFHLSSYRQIAFYRMEKKLVGEAYDDSVLFFIAKTGN